MRWSAALLLACGGSDPAAPSDPGGSDTDPDALDTDAPPPPLPAARICDQGALEPVATGSFDAFGNEVTALGEARHVAEDTVASDGGPMPVHAKFAYGAFNDDLEDERVEVWLDVCGPSPIFVGEVRTDDTGRVDLAVDPGVVDGYGWFGLHFRVVGDGTLASAVLRKLPVGARVVVFDIDGTLTTADSELFADLFSELGSGSYVPEARVDAVATVQARVDQGYEVVYLTGRPYWLDALSRGWLADLGFPPGAVRLARTNEQVLPIDSGVGDYKAAFLADLLASGLEIDHAYGNATTDIYAYATAGIPLDVTWITGDHGGEGGTVDLGDDYSGHLPLVLAEPAVDQPFTW